MTVRDDNQLLFHWILLLLHRRNSKHSHKPTATEVIGSRAEPTMVVYIHRLVCLSALIEASLCSGQQLLHRLITAQKKLTIEFHP